MKKYLTFGVLFIIFLGGAATVSAQTKVNLLRHAVVITFKINTPKDVIKSVDQSFSNLAKLPMVNGFEWGVVAEEGKNQVKHIYITTFSNKQGEDDYGKSKEHQAHIKLGAEYVENVSVTDYLVNN
jgi:hypothetical protein